MDCFVARAPRNDAEAALFRCLRFESGAEERSARASAQRHPLLVTVMFVAYRDRAGRLPGGLDALDSLADLARGRAQRADADLAVRHAGAQRAQIGCDVVLRRAQAERLVFQ